LKYATNNRPFNWSNRFGHICLIVLAIMFCCCAPNQRPTVCGVPVQGTPWQLAAAIHDNGDGTFVPTCIDQITSTKAYISGYLLRDSTGALLPDELPATLICDLSEKGEVCGAVLHCENNEIQ